MTNAAIRMESPAPRREPRVTHVFRQPFQENQEEDLSREDRQRAHAANDRTKVDIIGY